MTDEERKQFLADRVRAASEIDPETAEVFGATSTSGTHTTFMIQRKAR